VCRAAAISNINQLFNLPILTEAFQQRLVLAQDLADISIEQEQDDMPMKAYKMLICTRQVHPCFSWLWKASTQKNTILAAFERWAKHKEHFKKEKQGSFII
jgi:hypothetical protein